LKRVEVDSADSAASQKHQKHGAAEAHACGPCAINIQVIAVRMYYGRQYHTTLPGWR
jgi:hypothetical protein